jgi:3-deoxy-7-phosphoheptulonate synthase
MIVVMKKEANEEEIRQVKEKIEGEGLSPIEVPGETRVCINVSGKVADKEILRGIISSQPGVQDIKIISDPYKLASLEYQGKEKLKISRTINGEKVEVVFNGSEISMMAGPCAIESEEQIFKAAEYLSKLGVKVLRGGAYKPRSSPYDFQGLGKRGLEMAREAANTYRMLFVTEMLNVTTMDLVAEYADIIQIGARNCQNFDLLKAAGQTGKPVLLKRGWAMEIKELLLSAEYILSMQRKKQVILCLRGIRTFENGDSRNTVDLGSIPILLQKTWLPVIFDPSHSTGRKELIPPVSHMALVGGTNGFLIETHPNPEKALVDGQQSLNLSEFELLYEELKTLAELKGKQLN